MCDSNQEHNSSHSVHATLASFAQADDGFVECPSESCAHDSCLDLLLRECPPVVAAEIQSTYDSACSLAPPSPPDPPLPPPLPIGDRFPPPPRPPPPQPYLEIRTKLDETDYEPDCQLVSYAACKNIVADYAGETEGVLNVLRVSAAPCEGLPDEPSCFLVRINPHAHTGTFALTLLCLLRRGANTAASTAGADQRDPQTNPLEHVLMCTLYTYRFRLYRFLLPDMQAEFNASNSYRCKQAEMPYCACGNPASPPPGSHAPPPPFVYTEEWHAQPSYVEGETPVLGGGVTDAATPWTTDDGQVSALTKRLVNGRTIDLALRSSHQVVDCPGNDDAEATCTRFCAQEHLGFLRAVAVTGARRTPPPPISPPPYSAPSPPRPPWNPFAECSNTCEDNDVLNVDDARCRDGGKVRLSF